MYLLRLYSGEPLRLINKVNFKIHDVTPRLTNSCNTHMVQYLKKKGNQTMKFGQLLEYNMRNIFLKKSDTKCGGETITKPFPKKLLSISLDQ